MPREPYVFISYSTKESSVAEQVRDILEMNHISCWMAPASIAAGSDYTRSIPQAIENCSAVVLICSKNAQTSNWVKSEIIAAINLNKTIVPFLIDNAELNSEFNFMLSHSQRIIAYENRAKAYETLVSSLSAPLYQTNPKPSPAPNPTPAPVTDPSAVPTPQVVVQKSDSYAAPVIVVWTLYLAVIAAALYLSIDLQDGGNPVWGAAFFSSSVLLVASLLGMWIVKRHKTAPVKDIKSKRSTIMLYFIAEVAIESAAAAVSILSGGSTQQIIPLVILLSALLFSVLSVAGAVRFRKTKYIAVQQ